jgi:hypothetical protein
LYPEPSRSRKRVALSSELKERKSRIQSRLRLLSGQTEIAVLKVERTTSGDPRALLTANVRIRLTDFVFSVWEDYRDIDSRPSLYAFKYSLVDPNSAELFRYECHPDVGDPQIAGEENTELVNNITYERSPHFHPVGTMHHHSINKLHYPFP